MANQNLANKYRPKTFDEIVEQTTVMEMVSRMCEDPNLKCRNFLFIGPAGCGKTTTARCIASKLNGSLDQVTEIDAASHNGVDYARELVVQAQAYPVGTPWKIFIVDECFPGNTWISTPHGQVQIKDIAEGERVYNLTGSATVTRIFKNQVKTANLVSLRIGGRTLITTRDHLIFTDNGWIPAASLTKGDIVYDYKTVQAMRESVSSEASIGSESSLQPRMSQSIHLESVIRKTYERISEKVSNMWKRLLDSQECECNNLFSEVFRSMEEAESKYGKIVGATCKTLAFIYLSNLSKKDGNSEQRQKTVLQSEMFSNSCTKQTSNKYDNQTLRMVWEFIYNSLRSSTTENMFAGMPVCPNSQSQSWQEGCCVVNQNAEQQSNVQSGNSSKDERDEEAEWNITQASCIAWWKRTLHQASDDAVRSFRDNVEVRISCSDKRGITQSEQISYELQTRPSLSRPEGWNRGGWCRPSYEIATIARREESDLSAELRVESVEIYKRGYNDKLFSSSFTDTELSHEYVTMYDLEIDGHPSYFANDILVHNCHSLSSAAWQTLLKVLEDGPAKTIWLMCTTNPEKIPTTIISRVQVFQLSKISLEGITNRLKYIIDCENNDGRGITYTDDAVQYIAKMANGGMRDAITTLDKALAYSNDLTIENVVKALGLPSYDEFFDLLSAYAKKDNASIAKIIDNVYNSGVNFIKWFENFHSFVIQILKYVYLQDINYTTIPSFYDSKLSKYNVKHANICLKLANILVKLNSELKSSQYLQELALTYLCSIRKEAK